MSNISFNITHTDADIFAFKCVIDRFGDFVKRKVTENVQMITAPGSPDFEVLMSSAQKMYESVMSRLKLQRQPGDKTAEDSSGISTNCVRDE